MSEMRRAEEEAGTDAEVPAAGAGGALALASLRHHRTQAPCDEVGSAVASETHSAWVSRLAGVAVVQWEARLVASPSKAAVGEVDAEGVAAGIAVHRRARDPPDAARLDEAAETGEHADPALPQMAEAGEHDALQSAEAEERSGRAALQRAAAACEAVVVAVACAMVVGAASPLVPLDEWHRTAAWRRVASAG